MAETPLGGWVTTTTAYSPDAAAGMGAIKTVVDTAMGRKTSPYDMAFAPSQYQSAVRETVMEGQRKAFGDGLGGQTANLIYQVLITSGDSALAMGLGGATGGSAIMALSATSGKTQQELLLGRDNSQALVQGLAAGVTEYITEKTGHGSPDGGVFPGKEGRLSDHPGERDQRLCAGGPGGAAGERGGSSAGQLPERGQQPTSGEH